jgi:hypothetical protein
MMKLNLSLLVATILAMVGVQDVCAFLPQQAKRRVGVQPLHEYIPAGMDPKEWRKLKEKEMNAKANKNLGAYGPSSFKSRSLQAFQKDLEKGKVGIVVPPLCVSVT